MNTISLRPSRQLQNYFGYEQNQLLYSHCEICRANLIIFISYFSSYSVRKEQKWRLKYGTFYNQQTGNIKSTLKAIQKITFRVALDCSYYNNGGGLTDTSPAALIRVLSPARYKYRISKMPVQTSKHQQRIIHTKITTFLLTYVPKWVFVFSLTERLHYFDRSHPVVFSIIQ
jgi:hypothetical protein